MIGRKITVAEARSYRWRGWCRWCKRRHIVTMRRCPTCGVYQTPQPASDAVADACGANYQCDGCLAYNDHLR